MKPRYVKRGVIAGSEFGTVFTEYTHSIRIVANQQSAALLFALGIPFRAVEPREDSGRAWYEFMYSDHVDKMLMDLVEFSTTLRESQPTFGQLELAI